MEDAEQLARPSSVCVGESVWKDALVTLAVSGEGTSELGLGVRGSLFAVHTFVFFEL